MNNVTFQHGCNRTQSEKQSGLLLFVGGPFNPLTSRFGFWNVFGIFFQNFQASVLDLCIQLMVVIVASVLERSIKSIFITYL
uniref:Uncharacterized protein n=1 Tax=Anguilla anguilla TaxID=7936 RepID=A0A0E9US55_ANGAN